MTVSPDADRLLSSYDFALPPECIAQRPAEPRHSARLLAIDPTGCGTPPWARHLRVWDLQHELQSGDLLVVNDTRVLRARLEARLPTGAAVELLVLEPWQAPSAHKRWVIHLHGALMLRFLPHFLDLSGHVCTETLSEL